MRSTCPGPERGGAWRAAAWLIVALSVALSAAACGGARQDRPPTQAALSASQPSVEAVLWWLPPDTEAVVVIDAPFEVPGLEAQPEISPAALLQAVTLAGLRNLTAGQLHEALAGATVLRAIEGARAFEPPTQAPGPARFEGAQVLVFAAPLDGQGGVWSKLETNAVEQRPGPRGPQLRFQEELTDALWTFWVAAPSPHVLIIATDQGYLEAMLERRGGVEAPRALPSAGALWRSLPADATLWAMRLRPELAAEGEPAPGVLLTVDAAGLRLRCRGAWAACEAPPALRGVRAEAAPEAAPERVARLDLGAGAGDEAVVLWLLDVLGHTVRF